MANKKSLTGLKMQTTVSPSDALDAVRSATALRGERGVAKVQGKWQKSNLQVLIDEDTDTYLNLKVAADQSQRGNLTFSANAERTDGGQTTLTVGGLLHYQVMQTKIFGLVPVGPGSIIHYGFYVEFLERVEQEMLALDPRSDGFIGVFAD
jgi:hypothetical protein